MSCASAASAGALKYAKLANRTPVRSADTKTALAAVQAGGISPAETEDLFSPEEIARLKLTIMTSQNAEERMEAVHDHFDARLGEPDTVGGLVGRSLATERG